MTDKELSDKSEEIEAVMTASPNDEDSEKRGGTFTKILGFVALVVVILAAGLAANGQLMPMIDDFRSQYTADEPVQAESATPDPADEPLYAPSHDEVATTDDTAGNTDVTETEPVETSLTLRETIDQLRTELQNMELSQQMLREGIYKQQQVNLQVRLRWITDPGSRIAQIQLAWEEIALLPQLSDEQREIAQQMNTLALANIQKLRTWQASLQRWSETLKTPEHENILPTPEHPWLAWIVGQFHLRQAPTEEARRLQSLRERMMQVAAGLVQEQWPDNSQWQTLYAELLLQVKAMDRAEGEAINLELPADFEAIAEDMNRVRAIDPFLTQPQGQGVL